MRIGHLGNALLLATLALTIVGCARSIKYDPPGSESTKVEAPLYITFNSKGKPVVLDSEGKELAPQGTAAEIPNPSTIKRVNQITTLEIHGSHYYLLYIDGKYYKIPLPH